MANKLQTATQVINHLYANGHRYELNLHDETWIQEQAIMNLFNIIERLETDKITAPYLLQRLHMPLDGLDGGPTIEHVLYKIKDRLK